MNNKILDVVIPKDLDTILKLIKHDFKLDGISNLDIKEDTILLLHKHRLLFNLQDHNLKSFLSVELFIQINHSLKIAKLLNLAMQAEMIRLARLLNDNNIKYAILKGTPLSKILFKDSLTRHAKDIDIWISQDDLERVLHIIQSVGYKLSNPSYKLEGFKKEYYLKHKHDVALFNQKKNIEIEIHFKLSSSYYDFRFFNIHDIPLIRIEFSNTNITIMDHNYHFLYLILHGSKHAWFRLKWLYDIYLYLKTDLIQLFTVLDLAKEINAEVILLQTLYLLEILFDFQNEESQNILRQNNKQVLYITKKALEIIVSNDEVSILNNPFNKTALRYRIYLFYMDKALNHGFNLKYFMDAFFQIDILFEKYSFKYKHTYYIIYPFEIVYIMIKSMIKSLKKCYNTILK